jgi:hypothetical protein
MRQRSPGEQVTDEDSLVREDEKGLGSVAFYELFIITSLKVSDTVSKVFADSFTYSSIELI